MYLISGISMKKKKEKQKLMVGADTIRFWVQLRFLDGGLLDAGLEALFVV